MDMDMHRRMATTSLSIGGEDGVERVTRDTAELQSPGCRNSMLYTVKKHNQNTSESRHGSSRFRGQARDDERE